MIRLALFTFLIFLVSADPVSAEEVAHDPRSCPDLTGFFLLPDPVFEPMPMTLKSSVDRSGTPTLLMRVEEGDDLILLDGIKKEAGEGRSYRAACFANTIYLYEYQNGEQDTLSTLQLDSTRDLEIIIDQKGKPKIHQVGVRQ